MRNPLPRPVFRRDESVMRAALKLVDADYRAATRVIPSDRIHTGFLVIENTQHVAKAVKAIRERWKAEARVSVVRGNIDRSE